MKYLVFAALSVFSVYASANNETHSPLGAGATATDSSVAAVRYDYSQNLDIAKVIKISTPSVTSCGPVTSHMIYQDSKGVTHNMEYTRMGDGCENG
ncbi:DUF2790 domain-containing protein [Pseudomonas sp. dw_358]|uniref:DUF2790 domain-containing protein n=1 Tax=Pseudomonas sp. dw_358 TaxID=2720083 RepID=UPI001BD42EA3|nr:DUF2790 domain-containing protein [Pseudomonas sp. dw_358]